MACIPLSFYRFVVAMIYLAVIAFVIVDVVHINKDPYNLVSGAGIIVYVLLFFIFSHSPAHVSLLSL